MGLDQDSSTDFSIMFSYEQLPWLATQYWLFMDTLIYTIPSLLKGWPHAECLKWQHLNMYLFTVLQKMQLSTNLR